MAKRKLKPHGSVAAARRHERAGEAKCPACERAIAEHNAEQYRKRREAATCQPGHKEGTPAPVQQPRPRPKPRPRPMPVPA